MKFVFNHNSLFVCEVLLLDFINDLCLNSMQISKVFLTKHSKFVDTIDGRDAYLGIDSKDNVVLFHSHLNKVDWIKSDSLEYS